MALPPSLVAIEATFVLALIGAGVFAIRDTFGTPAAYAGIIMLAVIAALHIREGAER